MGCKVRGCATPVLTILTLFALGQGPLSSGATPEAAEAEDLTRLSLQELGQIEVTSVSKVTEPLHQAAASIYVITHEEIVRSGANKLSEVLRLAPNLRVTQLTSSYTTLTARGFGGNQADQAFPNKLLILIDGRSVYTPLYSGIYLDAQDVVLEDVDRIEVISGPGATLWGANAVNGVINVITRPSYLSSGALISAGAGNQEQAATARYGGQLSEESAYRAYAKTFHEAAEELPDGSSAHDGWNRSQGGFRWDWQHQRDTVTAQGDVYRGTEGQLGQGDLLVLGGNALTRWQHATDRSQLQLQAYYDQSERAAPPGGAAFVLHTYDVELQQRLNISAANELVWGAGERVNSYAITNTSSLLFLPSHRNLTLANLFAQDTLAFAPSLKLTLGLKAEDDPYAGWSLLPDVKGSWQASEREFLWVGASRAIRSPTPLDVDVAEKLGGLVFLAGNPAFRTERVNAYQLGYRAQPIASVALSVSGFYNVYDDLRTIEPASSPSFLPLRWGNDMEGHTYGVEAWGDWQVLSAWRLSPGFVLLHKSLHFTAAGSGLLGVAQAGDDPSSQASLKSSFDLAHGVSLDALLRYVAPLPNPALGAYTEASVRLGWRLSQALEVSVAGNNLLHARHYEYPPPDGEQIVRSGSVQLRWMR